MLTIRLQRLGKTHYATYRIVVQDVRQHPSSGKVVAYLGSYNPHSKEVQLNKETAEKFLANGAQPTDRVVKILTKEGMTMPKWVKTSTERKRAIRNPEKLRKNQPKEEPVAEATDESSEA